MKLLTEILQTNVGVVIVDSNVINDSDYDMLFESKFEEPAQTNKRKNLHLDHVEDLIIRHGAEGMNKVLGFLHNTHNHLLGKKKEGFNIMTKMDGSPSIIWGHDPHTKKFFVGTKSFFNKTPKVNYTPKDIETNHGKSPGLVQKLKFALDHLKKITPKEGIYHGDLMYTSDDVQDSGEHYSFTPNTITYNIKKSSVEGKKVAASKIGIAPHTQFERDLDGQLRAKFGVDLSKFKESPDVHVLDTNTGGGKYEYGSSRQKQFLTALSQAQQLHSRMSKTGGFDHIKDHSELLLAYINRGIKEKKTNSVEGYITFLNGQFKKRMDGLKLDKSKEGIRKHLDDEIKNVLAHKSSFNNLFTAHKHIQNAKQVLVKSLSEKSPYGETILGNKSKPEGFVASVDNEPTKLVDRDHFSAANFDWNEKVNPEDNPTVLTWGRMNPPTAGHGRVLSKAQDIARRTGAKQVNMTTKTAGNAKNPLSPADKMKWMKAMFPGQQIAMASDENSTIVSQLQHMHNSGVRHLTLVAGQDRLADYTKILSKYNGHGPGKLFHFKKVRVVSAGDRDPNASGVEGVSGTKMRTAAANNDFTTFRKGMPGHVQDKDARNMFTVLRSEMGKVQVDNLTHKKSLSTLAKDGDKVAKHSRKEIERRKKG